MQKKEVIENCLFECLPYRKKLGIDFNFGVEVEAGLQNSFDKTYIYTKELKAKKYILKEDDTIHYSIPLEIASPKLVDKAATWDDLLLLSDRMKKCDLDFSECAFQVNIDNDLSNEELITMLKMFAIYEDVIYRFSKGFDNHLRRMSYAMSVRNRLVNYLRCSRNDIYILNQYNWNKSFGIALKSRIKDDDIDFFNKVKIIEFRTPNGCDDAWLWQNYINTFYCFLKSVKSIDLEKIDYDCQQLNEACLMGTYELLRLDRAFEFANIIFTKDIDKLYFMRQYIGLDKERVIDEYRLTKR